MARSRFNAKCRWTVACLIAGSIVTAPTRAKAIDRTVTPREISANNGSVSAVTGESWLNHLHRNFGETSMGKTGRLGPATLEDQLPPASSGSPSSAGNRTVILHGSDLYRLNCQGCHGEAGLGAPPEIGSVINPVRATSTALVMDRMKKAGMDISHAEASQLAGQSKSALLKRLHSGGQDMPAFPQLSEAEIRALVAYLKQLADMPGAAKEQLAVRESPVRIGELIVKSTCHTCHGAEGRNPNPEQLLQGAIPPLNTLTTRTNQFGLVRKVTSGAPVVMGTPYQMYRGRMPVFFYLSADEAADVYRYLTEYKPSAAATSAAVISKSEPVQRDTAQSQNILAASFLPPAQAASSDGGIDMRIVGAVGFFVALLLAGGVVITGREFKRMSQENEIRRWEQRSARLHVLRQGIVCPIRAPAGSDRESIAGLDSKSEKRMASGLRR